MSMTKKAGAGAGSISQKHRSANPDPYPYQNVTDPQNWKNLYPFLGDKGQSVVDAKFVVSETK
jgi:hypothetical protein